jgi:hypothetical protein
VGTRVREGLGATRLRCADIGLSQTQDTGQKNGPYRMESEWVGGL